MYLVWNNVTNMVAHSSSCITVFIVMPSYGIYLPPYPTFPVIGDTLQYAELKLSENHVSATFLPSTPLTEISVVIEWPPVHCKDSSARC